MNLPQLDNLIHYVNLMCYANFLCFLSIEFHIILVIVLMIRDDKLTGKFGYPPRPVPFGTGMEILYSGMGTFTKTRLGFGAGMGF